jgi:hypothetical protein
MTPITPSPPFKVRTGTRKMGVGRTDGQCHTERTPTRRTKGVLSWLRAPHRRHPTRTAPPSWPWQLKWPTRTTEPTKPPSKRDIPITTGTTLTPYMSRDTSARQGCGGGPVDDLVSVRGCFDHCEPTEIPTCRLKMSPSEGRSLGGEEWGGGVTSPSSPSSFSSSSSPPEDSSLEGVSSPCALAATREALQSHLPCLCAHSRLL